MATAPDYDFYSTEHMGSLPIDAFESAVAEAGARLRAVTGRSHGEVPDAFLADYLHAWCALVDRSAGLDRRGVLQSETVGSTSVTYAAGAGGTSFSDYDAVLPWLSGTGLLCQAVGGAYGL